MSSLQEFLEERRPPPAKEEGIGRSLEAAQKAFASWKNVPGSVRAQYLRRTAFLMRENREFLAELMAKEMGKPVTEGLGEVEYSASFFDWFAGEAERIYGMTVPSHHPYKSLMLVYEPVGVCGVITPWNFPLAMPARKIAAALAAGCTVAAKPSGETAASMLLFAHFFEKIGLPEGVFNVLLGDGKFIGKALLHSPIVRKISFTGSTEVGRHLYEHSAGTLKKLTLELGGHAPFLVFDDADLEIAVKEAVVAKFRNTGQTCVAANRFLVQKGIYDAFLERFTEAVKALQVGSPFDPATEVSTVLHPASEEKVRAHIDDALEQGAKALLKGKEPYEPTILTEVTPKMRIFREETFGPVAPITPFSTFEEGIALANDTPFGLAAYLCSSGLKQAHRAAAELQYGVIGVNDGLPSSAETSFGGVKQSGLGREGGPTGIYEYLVEKFVSVAFS